MASNAQFNEVANLIAVQRSKGPGESLGCLRGLKPSLFGVEAMPGAERRRRVFFK